MASKMMSFFFFSIFSHPVCSLELVPEIQLPKLQVSFDLAFSPKRETTETDMGAGADAAKDGNVNNALFFFT